MSDAALAFELHGGCCVLFSEREHGNASEVSGACAEHAQEVREQLRALTGVRGLARGRQVHGSVVRRVREAPSADAERGAAVAQPEPADGQATALRSVGAMVLSADCLPVALACDGAVATVHAGWRGLAAGVLEEGVRAVRELGSAQRVQATIGPGAGACCYEVGAEVHERFPARHRRGRRIDLKGIARELLLAEGVLDVLDLELAHHLR